ncbi:MAG: ArsA-related P-loop ATPase [Myxococcota bacterium]|nr:ArsA-related P-loop ATPase [Myxococcota bacterium]
MTDATSLLDRRVLIVLGKGGVGKSVVSAALGLQAAQAGRRAVIAEMSGAESMATLFDREPVGYAGAALAENLTGLSICPSEAVEEYLIRMLKFRLLYEVVFRNRYIEPFMNGVMGLSDLISIGKVMDLEWSRADGTHGPDPQGPPAYDLVVVDSPSTGHGLSLLRSPQAIMDITRVGPLYSNARMIRDLLADKERCGVVLVTIAEEMVVNETIELAARLRNEVAIDIAGVVVNGLPPRLFESPEAEACWEELRAFGSDAGGRAAQAVADAERSLRDRQRAEDYIQLLRDQLELPIAEVPLLSRRDLDAEALLGIGQHLRWVQ